MGRHVDIDLVLSSAQIAEKLNLSSYAVVTHLRTYHPTFPMPVLVAAGRSFWYWPDVETWVAENPLSKRFFSRKRGRSAN